MIRARRRGGAAVVNGEHQSWGRSGLRVAALALSIPRAEGWRPDPGWSLLKKTSTIEPAWWYRSTFFKKGGLHHVSSEENSC